METRYSYKFKAFDYKTGATSFLFKAAFILEQTERIYKLSYVPVGRYSSILMLDFLLGRAEGWKGELHELLSEAVREQLSEADTDSLIVIGGRKQDHDAFTIKDHIEADRPITRKNKLTVVKEFALSKRLAEFGLEKANIHDLAFRVDQDQLFIDFSDAVAHRDIVSDLDVQKSLVDASRKYVFDSYKMHARLLAERDYTFNQHISNALLALDRDIVSDLLNEQSLGKAVRDIVSDVTIEAAAVKATRDIVCDTRIYNVLMKAMRDNVDPAMLGEGGVAKRHISNPSLLVKAIYRAVRHAIRDMLLSREYKWADLKARQYPAMITGRGVVADRRIVDLALLPFVHRWGVRHNIADLAISSDEYRGKREHIYPLAVNKEHLLAERDIVALLHINNERPEGHRDIVSDLDVGRGMTQAVRDNVSGLYIPRHSIAAVKEVSKPTIVMFPSLKGRREKHLHMKVMREHIQAIRKHLKEGYTPGIEPGSSKGPKRSYLHDDVFESGKLPHLDIVFSDEVLWGDTSTTNLGVLGLDLIATPDERQMLSVLEADFIVGDKERKALEGYVSDFMAWANRLRVNEGIFLEDLLLYKGFYSYIMEEFLLADRYDDRESFIDSLFSWALKEGKESTILDDPFIKAVRERIEGLLDLGFLVSDHINERDSLVLFDTLGTKEAHSGNLEEVIVGHEEPKPSIVEEGLVAGQEPKPSIINDGVEALQEPKPSHMEQELVAGQEPKPSILEEVLVGEDEFRPSIIHVENPFGYIDDRNGFFINDTLEASRPQEHSAEHMDGLAGEKEDHGAVIGDDVIAQKGLPGTNMHDFIVGDLQDRPSVLEGGVPGEAVPRQTVYEEALTGLVPDRMGNVVESPTGYVEDRKGDLSIQLDSATVFRQQVAALSTAYVLATTSKDRAAALAEMYLVGEQALRESVISEEEYLKFVRLVLLKGYLGEQYFAEEPPKATELFEHIIAILNPDGGVLEDVLTNIIGDREAAKAIIEQHKMAVRPTESGGLVLDDFTGFEQIKQALLEQAQPPAQGLIYDIGDDILQDSYDLEQWDSGYGIPEDYDPHDPFNPYYPWVDEVSGLELAQTEWLTIGAGDLKRNPLQGKFYISNTPDIGGFVYNNFQYTDYVFRTDFKVNGFDDSEVGVIFRYQNDQNYYYFAILGGGTTVKPMQLYKVVNGVRTTMAAPMNPFTYIPDEWYTVEVIVLDRRITIRVNGRLQYDLVD